jgi:hypothetical protein
MTAVVVTLAAIVALLTLLVAGLLRSNAELIRAMHQLGVDLGSGAAADPAAVPLELGLRPTPARPDPADVIDVVGVTPRGDAVKVAVAPVAHDTLLAFLTSGCTTCRAFWESFAAGAEDVPGGARLVVVTRGPDSESPGTVARLSAEAVPVVMSSEAWEHYDVPYAPYFVYLSGPRARVIGEGAAAGWDQVRALVATAVADSRIAGTPGAPSLETVPAPGPDASELSAGPARRATGVRRPTRSDQRREEDVDRELRAAGIVPGDPRLHHSGSLHDPPERS